MAAATTDMAGAAGISLSDIEAALVYSVSQALCTAATAEPFLPDACAQAAKAYKHDAFAGRLNEYVKTTKRVQAVLTQADRQVCKMLLSSPEAEQFIDTAGIKAQPQYTPPATAGGRGSFKTPQGCVKTRKARNMAVLWTLRYGLDYFGAEACRTVQQQPSSYDAIAAALAHVLQHKLSKTATDIEAALNTVLLQCPLSSAAPEPAPKRQRRDSDAVFKP